MNKNAANVKKKPMLIFKFNFMITYFGLKNFKKKITKKLLIFFN